VSPATCIDGSTVFSGKLRCDETIRIDGRLKGELRCEQTVIVGESAHLEARIDADTVVIAGQVKGDIAARRKITLEKSARVVGDLRTCGIVIEEGAMLQGRIVIGSEDRPASEKRPTVAPRASATSEAASQPAS
jgi:cytoskeletal protein CcmA (bactofilin family)